MRAFVRRHSDALAIFAMTSLMLFGVYQLGEQQDARRGATDVAACERGNVIRDYLAFDNTQAIIVLRASLIPPQDTSAAERLARQVSLVRRIAEQQTLVPFNCESLR